MTDRLSQPYRYRAFISYNHEDKAFAQYLHRKLESYSVEGSLFTKRDKPLSPVFLDEAELRAGTKLSDAIQEALSLSEYLIVICSEKSASSKWVKAEIALMQSLHDEPKIIGVIPPKNGDESHINQLLGQSSEHLGADFRSGTNKYLQLSKIAATMTDADLDSLYRRETRRKNKQMLGVAGGLSLVTLIMSGLAANAYYSEKEAVRQRQQSEEVIAFMIDEFRDDLESLEKLEILDKVGQRAQTYFDDRDLNLLSHESVLLQSRTLRQLGDVDEKRGKLTSSKQRIIGAHKASAHMLQSTPDRLEAILEHAENTDFWVYLEYQIGDLAKAKALAHEVLDIYDTGLTHFPDNEALVWKRSLAEQNVGVMLLQSGRADEAKPYFERTLTAIKAENETRSLTEDELYDYVNIYTWYIRSLPDSTPIAFLYETRQNQLQLLAQLKTKGANPIRSQAESLNVERAVVHLLLQLGRDLEAESLMLSIQSRYEDLLLHDAENIGWRRHLMRSKLNLARLRNKMGDIASRNQIFRDIKALQQKPDGTLWLATTDITLGMNRLEARKLYDEGRTEDALSFLDKAEQDIRDYRKDKIRPRDKYNMASLNDLKVEFLIDQSRATEAADVSTHILDLLSGKNSYSIGEQRMQLLALQRVEKPKAALALRQKLTERGVVLP